ncbi:MAG: hypothetical protein LBG76_06145 [Treponema sp.]|jgi:hypothetical protein|nr:hypothetical protein [Treponema sp.]
METKADTEGRAPEYGQYQNILQLEIGMAERIAAIQILVREAVRNREWADFEAFMEDLSSIGEEFEALDAERARIFGEERGFYALCARFPEGERKNITDLFRRLKGEITKIRLENDALQKYLSEARVMISGFLEILFPERRGRIYSRRGTQINADMRSMVLNQHL